MLNALTIAWRVLNRVSTVAAGILLMILIAECNLNIIGRYFRKPIRASYDLLSFVAVLMVAASLIPTEFSGGHVVVSTFILKLIKKRIVQRILESVSILINLAAVLLLVWTIVDYIVNISIPDKEMALTLQISCIPFRVVWALGWMLLCLGILKKLVERISQGEKK